MGERLPTNPIRRIGEFAPWWIKCRDCGDLAVMSPDWGKRSGQCKCKNCGALYKIPINRNYARQVVDLPLWLKASFRENVLWAVNGEHLDYLEQVVGATLRERPILNSIFCHLHAVQSSKLDSVCQESAGLAPPN